MSETENIIVGLDLGKATVSVATATLSEDGALSDVQARSERHLGAPVEFFRDFYRELDHGRIAAIAATGVFSNRLKEPIISGVPEETAQELATRYLYPDKRPLNVVRMGARGYSILTIDENGAVRFEENDKCSSGTGETVEKICGRLGLSLEEALDAAGEAGKSIPISARCSVFAKSEMTHFANQGEPHEKLVKGYFESVARNLYSLYDKFKIPGPVVLIGNGASMGPIREAFAELLPSGPSQVSVSPEAGVYEAIGALRLAAERANGDRDWPRDPQSLVREKRKRIQSMAPASAAADKVVRLSEKPAEVPDDSPAIMGIDLGSTGSKAVLVDVATGDVIADLYRRTDGNPVEAAKALVAGLYQMTGHPVVAFGLCGSGRYAAATVFKAAYPELGERIYVQNEIVAHATAAAKYDDHNGQSLSIVEIGGQDAKFINMQGGRVVESDMNRACSAGTGSFLEEQAIFYGLKDIAQFGPMAASSKNPPNLGQMCTVFVAELASEALSEGYSVEDLFAGFQYSVITNYKNRVMGNRQFMERIFFQGKPATNASLAQTLAAVTNRRVIVPPNPGAMGAIGIALLARKTLASLAKASAIDAEKILNAQVSSKKTFRCKDSKCSNLCRIEAATIDVGEERRKVVSGGRCPKYEEAGAGLKKLPKDAPNAYLEREQLLQSLTEANYTGLQTPTVGIPYGHYTIEFAPFFHSFLRELGLRVEIVRSDHETFQRGNARCTAQNTCTPVKLMHGLADKSYDCLFMPKIVNVPEGKPGAGASTCPMTQGAPEMVEHALKAEGADVKVLRPIFHLEGNGVASRKFTKELKAFYKSMSARLDGNQITLKPFAKAYRKALKTQREYERGLMEIGARTVEFAEKNSFPVVLLVGNSHVVHEPIMNAGIQNIVAQNGAMALPLDCFPIPEDVSAMRRVYWGNSNRTMRASVAAAEKGFIFPALIVSYGCGPSSFLEHVFNDLLENYPHTVLESDGHGGQAGYVTRVQAFLHAARSYEKGDEPAVDPERVQQLDTYPAHSPQKLKNSRIVVLSVGPKLGKHLAMALRAQGYDAHFSGLTDQAGFKKGRESCSGKECLPYQLIWGSFRKWIDENPPTDGRKTLMLNVTGYGPCRNGMFTPANEVALRKLGLEDTVEVATYGNFRHAPAVIGGTWFSVIVTDLLNQMRFHYRPVEKNPGDSDRLFDQYADRMEDYIGSPVNSKGIKGMRKALDPIERLVAEAAREFAKIPTVPELEESARTVYLAGDIYLRIDEFGSDDLARKLNERGLRIIYEPFAEIFEFIALKRSPELVEMETGLLRNKMLLKVQGVVSRKLYAAAAKLHPYIKYESPRAVEKASLELLDGTPFSEAICTIGSSLLAWNNRPIDGVVVVSPWGCGPALISEAQLRRRADIPLLFIYNDGDPIDEAKISGFAWRLKRKPPRALEPAFNPAITAI